MGYIIALLLLAVSFHSSLSDDSCPSFSIITPCNCDGEGINCMKAKSDAQLQKIFSAIPKPQKFRGVWIQTTDMTILQAGMFKGIEVQNFYIEVNRVHTVQKGAFAGSEGSCYTLSVFGNQIADFPFEDLKTFSYLQIFNAGRNKLTSIPANAFSGHPYLNQILLPENHISYIGSYAFNDLPILGQVNLLHNPLVMVGPYAFAMNKHSFMLTVNLANCSISNIAPTAFQGMTPYQLNLAVNRLQHLEEDALLPMVRRMAQGDGGHIETVGNQFHCKGCSYRWMVINKNILQTIMPSFHCMDGRNLNSLGLHNIGC